MPHTFVLVHSPLVGPFTWEAAARELRARGAAVIVPVLDDSGDARTPFWRREIESAARAVPEALSAVLVGHSGAGPLLPALRRAMRAGAAGYIFVDAGLPLDGATRLDLMRQESPEFASEFEQWLAGGGLFPEWSDEDLREIVPGDATRRALLAQLQPRGRAFFEEPLPVFAGWPDAPCAYLQFSPAYDAPASRARELGWPFRALQAGHFHMLVDPAAVAAALLELAPSAGPH